MMKNTTSLLTFLFAALSSSTAFALGLGLGGGLDAGVAVRVNTEAVTNVAADATAGAAMVGREQMHDRVSGGGRVQGQANAGVEARSTEPVQATVRQATKVESGVRATGSRATDTIGARARTTVAGTAAAATSPGARAGVNASAGAKLHAH